MEVPYGFYGSNALPTIRIGAWRHGGTRGEAVQGRVGVGLAREAFEQEIERLPDVRAHLRLGGVGVMPLQRGDQL